MKPLKATKKDLVVSVDMPEAVWRKTLDDMAVSFKDQPLRGYSREKSYHPYSNVIPNISVRDGLSRSDYNDFRSDERREGILGEIQDCIEAYMDIPVVHNTINLMGDFSVQGIDLVHPNPETEKFYKEWWKLVGGPERSERILNLVFKAGTAIIVRDEANTTPKAGVKQSRKVPPKVPTKYTIFSPLQVETIAEGLNSFVTGGAGAFALRIPDELAKTIVSPQSDVERKLVAQLPTEVRQAAKTKDKMLPIQPEKVSTISFKKDDGETWGTPIVRPILNAVQLYRKMQLADLSVLDGAINQIRVWKLGSFEHKVFPNANYINAFAALLQTVSSSGVADLAWDEHIELIETQNKGHEFLGDAKYKQVMADLYCGLGVPPTLSGTNTDAGTTNNLVSIKTLIERLEYGRMLLGLFWTQEIERVQKAMGFRFPATLVYDRMVLSDDAAELALLIQLVDRDLISMEYLQERFGAVPEIEEVRLRRENRRRKKGLLPKKSGPFHESEKTFKKEMAFVSGGRITPSQVGLNLPPPKESELLKEKVPPAAAPAGPGGNPLAKKKGIPQQGRPINSKDKTTRKKKRVKPIGASLAYVMEAQTAIAEHLRPLVLSNFSKANLRQLTDEESNSYEALQYDTLFALDNRDISSETIEDAIKQVSEGKGAPQEALDLVQAGISQLSQSSSKLTLEKIRLIKAGAYLELDMIDPTDDESDEVDTGADVEVP